MARALLTLAGTLTAAVSLLHLVVLIVGAPAYRYFGAGEVIAKGAEGGAWWPAAQTLGMAVLFLVCSVYAFVGASFVRRRPPLLRTGLLLTGVIFAIRGMSFVPQVMAWLWEPAVFPGRYVTFSLLALAIGVLYLAGTLGRWRALAVEVR